MNLPAVMPANAGIQKYLSSGFRVAPAIASLPGMTLNYGANFRDSALVFGL